MCVDAFNEHILKNSQKCTFFFLETAMKCFLHLMINVIDFKHLQRITAHHHHDFMIIHCSLAGVCAVQPEWIPKLLPQYCHFSAPEESPAPWYCPQTGRIKCQQQSTFCKTTPLSFYSFICLSISELRVVDVFMPMCFT